MIEALFLFGEHRNGLATPANLAVPTFGLPDLRYTDYREWVIAAVHDLKMRHGGFRARLGIPNVQEMPQQGLLPHNRSARTWKYAVVSFFNTSLEAGPDIPSCAINCAGDEARPVQPGTRLQRYGC